MAAKIVERADIDGADHEVGISRYRLPVNMPANKEYRTKTMRSGP
jgi:hypothetical protein